MSTEDLVYVQLLSVSLPVSPFLCPRTDGVLREVFLSPGGRSAGASLYSACTPVLGRTNVCTSCSLTPPLGASKELDLSQGRQGHGLVLPEGVCSICLGCEGHPERFGGNRSLSETDCTCGGSSSSSTPGW